MGFNDLMHPRNIYRNAPPDFKVLGEKFDYFRKHTKETKPGRFTLNFKNPEALRALTCALLEHDFKIKISIPLDRLIPTVPLRLNYVLWIEDLLSCLSEDHCHAIVRGFDIGKIIIPWCPSHSPGHNNHQWIRLGIFIERARGPEASRGDPREGGRVLKLMLQRTSELTRI